MEKVLYKGIFEGYPLSMVMIDGILTFRFINLWGDQDEYEYILDDPEEAEEGDIIDDDYQCLREDMARRLGWLTAVDLEPEEEDIIQALGETLVSWDVDIYSEEGKELEDQITAIHKYLTENPEEAKKFAEEMNKRFYAGKN